MGSIVLLDLMGGVALLLWGLHMVLTGVLRAFGPHLGDFVFQAHSPRSGLFKREPDIVGTNASCDRHKGLGTLLRYLANGL